MSSIARTRVACTFAAVAAAAIAVPVAGAASKHVLPVRHKQHVVAPNRFTSDPIADLGTSARARGYSIITDTLGGNGKPQARKVVRGVNGAVVGAVVTVPNTPE